MYLVVPNGGYNADSLPVRVDLYHESAYLCLGTNKMKRLYLNIMKWYCLFRTWQVLRSSLTRTW